MISISVDIQFKPHVCPLSEPGALLRLMNCSSSSSETLKKLWLQFTVFMYYSDAFWKMPSSDLTMITYFLIITSALMKVFFFVLPKQVSIMLRSIFRHHMNAG